MGVHVMEINAFRLQVSSQSLKSTSTSVGALASIVSIEGPLRRCTPVVLHLRRGEALLRSTGASDLANIQQQERLFEVLVKFLNSSESHTHTHTHTHTQTNHTHTHKHPFDSLNNNFVVLVMSLEDVSLLSPRLREIFRAEININDLPISHREAVVRSSLADIRQYKHIHTQMQTEVEEPIPNTAGLKFEDLQTVAAMTSIIENTHTHTHTGSDAHTHTHLVQCVDDISCRLVSRLSTNSEGQRGGVCWEDLGALQKAKKEVIDAVVLPLTHPKLFHNIKLRSGMLLYGPPGTGKTMLAKAVSHECGVHFISVKGPELLDKYIGESERHVRDIFRDAALRERCVVFFDELDSLAPKRGRGSDSAGVCDRVLSQMLTELDNLPSNVFVIGATNRPDLIDSSLLVPGRLDRLVYVPVPEDKISILKALTRKYKLDKEESSDDFLRRVASRLPITASGADIAGVCEGALCIAAKEKIKFLSEYAKCLGVTVNTLVKCFSLISANTHTHTHRKR
eukprot:GHVR01023904.1.p1 GENE.GHVR01023904.1~~GHVR01023904.1.p1  ORF type:complete len:510 (+),score=182.12 GHVR01023904.1:255-1784(+)